jgi:hypothetical protein
MLSMDWVVTGIFSQIKKIPLGAWHAQFKEVLHAAPLRQRLVDWSRDNENHGLEIVDSQKKSRKIKA